MARQYINLSCSITSILQYPVFSHLIRFSNKRSFHIPNNSVLLNCWSGYAYVRVVIGPGTLEYCGKKGFGFKAHYYDIVYSHHLNK